jgi:hypothetical protein
VKSENAKLSKFLKSQRFVANTTCEKQGYCGYMDTPNNIDFDIVPKTRTYGFCHGVAHTIMGEVCVQYLGEKIKTQFN